jgi:hypothetical protein
VKNLTPAIGLMLVALSGATAGRAASIQTPIDGVLASVGGDIVTVSDVRQARLLKLIEPSGDTDQAYVDALINRRLMLADLRRNPPPEPTTEAVDAKQQEWTARLGAGANVPDLLLRAGMSDAGLRGWLRDDLRLEVYLDQRFGTSSNRPAAIASWVGMLRQRAGIR